MNDENFTCEMCDKDLTKKELNDCHGLCFVCDELEEINKEMARISNG
jgi:hypothetical protein